MWKFSLGLALVAAALAAGPPLQDPSAFDQPGAGSMFDHTDAPAAIDNNSLRDRVDETEPLYDALARETRRLDKSAKEALYQSLRMDYGLGGQVGVSRRILEGSENRLDLQDAQRSQEDLVKHLGLDDPQGEAQANKLQVLEQSLVGVRDELQRELTSQQKDLNDKDGQQLREWLMVSEGLLRRHREAAEAAALAHPPAEAPPINAAGISPVAQALSPAAGTKP
jgi:hypothetical protein